MNNDGDAAATLAKVRKLIDTGREPEARHLLLARAFVDASVPALQQAYVQLFKIEPTLQEVLDLMYAGLASKDPKVRLASISAILKELGKSKLRNKTLWMRDPRASGPLIDAASDPDRKVSERALAALANLIESYFPDQRALPTLLGRLADADQAARLWAMRGISCYRREEWLRHLEPFLRSGTDSDRSEVAGQVAAHAVETLDNFSGRVTRLSAAGRRYWRPRMVGALADPVTAVRREAAAALGALGDATSVAPLREARKIERDPDTAYEMDEAISSLGG